MKQIAVISDTHGLLREEVKEKLKSADIIFHAGDINTQAIVDEIKSYAPLYIVRGNNDKEWATDLPLNLYVTIDGVRFFMTHNKKDIPADLDVDVVIFGHSHKYEEKDVNGVTYLNPGSCGKRRFDLEISMGMITIENEKVKINKIEISHS